MSITTWNRLECDTVFDDPARGVNWLAAAVFDPLWLLATSSGWASYGRGGGSLIHAEVTSASGSIASLAVAGHTGSFREADRASRIRCRARAVLRGSEAPDSGWTGADGATRGARA